MYEIYCELRDARGMKDADVARETGITKSTFQIGKTVEVTRKMPNFKKIADLFGVSVEYIRTGKEKEGGEKYYLNEETAEMATLMNTNADDYETYEEWAGKLQDVYTEYAAQITDAYTDSASNMSAEDIMDSLESMQ